MSDYVIIGDGISGATAAGAIRDELPEADIKVITDESEPLYNRINIKEYAKGRMPEEAIRMHTEAWYDERDIDLLLDTLVWKVENDDNTVVLHDGTELSYDKLLVAAGGSPRNLPVPHSTADGIHNFWTFVDSRKIRRDAENADHGIVVGAGLLGIDFAYALGANDVDAKYLMRGDRWWRYGLDNEGAEIIHDELESIGVEPVFGEGVDRFEIDKMGHVETALGTTGKRYPCDIAGVCIGLDLNTEIVDGTGIETNEGIRSDEYLRTNDPDVFVAGDINEFYDVTLDEYNVNGSWDSAKKQGEVAGYNMANPNDMKEFEIVPKYSVSHFSMPFISLGSPTKGEEFVSKKYGEKDYRRLAFKDGKLIGAVLIGNVRVVGHFTRIIKAKDEVYSDRDKLMEHEIDAREFL